MKLTVRTEVLTAMMSILVFWDVTPCGLIDRLSPENEGSMFLPNVGIYLQAYTALHLRIPTSTHKIFQG
jgi:hypothetical protein